MIDAFGLVRTDVDVASLGAPHYRRRLSDVIVDAGSTYNWIPADLLLEVGIAPMRIDRFATADGRVIEREVGFAVLYAADRVTATLVVFARDGESVVLGAHGLDGLNLRVDRERGGLVPAGPIPVAAQPFIAAIA